LLPFYSGVTTDKTENPTHMYLPATWWLLFTHGAMGKLSGQAYLKPLGRAEFARADDCSHVII
jgi:hypothetical protein